ncbi:MAG: sulfite exporter TauE/SafE family protein [Thermodesulfovibrionales bacterium]|nr:sulfite exporter TauE/SafE family protein [Thermodesulfovibrionales bacterium]
MDFLEVTYPVSGVTINVLIPPLIAFVVAFLSSIGGLSGAFLILPVMVSVLGFAGPSASATNFLFNIVAIPGGVYRYWREGRLFGPLAWPLIIGTVPGILVGYYLRISVLADPDRFRLFAGCVLGVIGAKLIWEAASNKASKSNMTPGSMPEVRSCGLTKTELVFDGADFSFNPAVIIAVSFIVGVIGGAYGIGGGALLVPFCVMAFGLPVYVVAGAALISTFAASVAGTAFYSLIPSSIPTTPDWLLGLSFGLGGLCGTYLGARSQKHLPHRLIKAILAVLLMGIAVKYVFGL